jgi:hypothetical protein
MNSTQEPVTHRREPQCFVWLRHRPGERSRDAQIYVRWTYGVSFYVAGESCGPVQAHPRSIRPTTLRRCDA